MWLGDMFADLGCQAFPSLHCRQALALSRKLDQRISTLVVNPKLPGASRMVKALLAANPGARVILIKDSAVLRNAGDAKTSANRNGFPAHATLERPSPWKPISRPFWLEKIRRILIQDSPS